MKAGNYVHIGFGEFVYLPEVIAIIKNSGTGSCRTSIHTDSGLRHTELRSETVISRAAKAGRVNNGI